MRIRGRWSWLAADEQKKSRGTLGRWGNDGGDVLEMHVEVELGTLESLVVKVDRSL